MLLTFDLDAPAGLLGMWVPTAAASEPSPTTGPDARAEVVWQLAVGDACDSTLSELGAAHRRLQALQERLSTSPAWTARTLRPAAGIDDPAASVLGQLVRAGTAAARIETRSRGQLVGRSQLAPSGQLVTVVRDRDRAACRLHQSCLMVVTASRLVALRVADLTLESAVEVASRLALPGGLLPALPIAWQLVRSLVQPAGADRMAT
jgi:hypothetical protein